MLKADLLRPSTHGQAELTVWNAMMAATPHLQHGFFAPRFARACEKAHGRVLIGVLHEGGTIRAFFPFQFRMAWHRLVGLAERIGDNLNDHAGLVAWSGFIIAPATLLRQCRLASMFLTNLAEVQTAFEIEAEIGRIDHRIDLAVSAAYFAELSRTRRSFVQDTERRLRRAEREFGTLQFAVDKSPDLAAASALIGAKRDQYRRTDAGDSFADPSTLRLIAALLERPTPECQPNITHLVGGEHELARHLGLMTCGVLNYWFPVYNPAAQKISPGRLLLWHTLRRAEAFGIRLVDRGEGDNEAKRDFSTGSARFGIATWSSRTIRAMAARAWLAGEWRVRRMTSTPMRPAAALSLFA
jgi:CelD/BcsL family acetyltransferase involved in cellulose biosynthesis